MNPVATIIRRNLLANRSVTIPGYGTIVVQRHGAQTVDSGRRLGTPVKKLVVTDSLSSTSLVEYIAYGLDVDLPQANLQFRNWITNATFEDHIFIDSVGSLAIGEDRRVELLPEFAVMLNANPTEKIVKRRHGSDHKTELRPEKENNTIWLVLSILAAVSAAAYLIYFFRADLIKLFP